MSTLQDIVETKRHARTAGVLYLALAVFGMFGHFAAREGLVVSGDATATVRNITENEFLFRLGFVSDLLAQTAFLLLALALYRLFKEVSRAQASLLVAFVVAAVPIAFLNMLNQFAALILAKGAEFLNVFEPAQQHALALLFMELQYEGVAILSLFWGLWLLPFGMLVIRSGFIPKVLGYFLVAGFVGYEVDFLLHFLFPEAPEIATDIALVPATVGEIGTLLWLLSVGARQRKTGESREAQLR